MAANVAPVILNLIIPAIKVYLLCCELLLMHLIHFSENILSRHSHEGGNPENPSPMLNPRFLLPAYYLQGQVSQGRNDERQSSYVTLFIACVLVMLGS